MTDKNETINENFMKSEFYCDVKNSFMENRKSEE